MKSKLIYLFLLSGFILYSFTIHNKNKAQQENHPPVVKVIAPLNNAVFDLYSPISYKITVSDKEDGESKYDEINAKEVLLEVRYLSQKPKTTNLNKVVQTDPPGLAVIKSSNCFNCHNFNSKSLGPSFYDMSRRYPVTRSNMDSLMKRVREGSSGIWPGREKMPGHAELTNDEIKNAVQWILKNGNDSNLNFYAGTEGSLRIKLPGTYALIASYTDHGFTNSLAKHLKGQDIAIIQVK